MLNRHVELAVAQSFVRLFLTRGQPQQAISSADVGVSCLRWCKARHLHYPTFAELSVAMETNGYLSAKSNGQRIWLGACWNADIDPITELTDTGCLRQLMQRPLALPLRVFIDLAGIGRSTFYAMEARGDAPRSYRRGNRVFIAAQDALLWCVERGRHSAVIAIADRVARQSAEVEQTRWQRRRTAADL